MAVNEGHCRCVFDFEFHAPGVPDDLDIEITKLIENLTCIVGVATRIQDRERALAKQRVESALPGREQFFDLLLGEALERSSRRDASVDELGNDDTGFHSDSSKKSEAKNLRAGCRWGCRSEPASKPPSCRHCSRRCSRPSSRSWHSSQPTISADWASRES